MGFVNKAVILALLFVISFLSSLHSEETDLITFIKKENAELLWNPLTETGIIMKADSEIIFKIGVPWILCDYSKKYFSPDIKRENGKIIFTEKTYQIIHDYFIWKENEYKTPRVAVILIDPGHGGKDPGAYYIHSPDKENSKIALYEKNLTLKVSLYLYELLTQRYINKNIILTRTTDKYLKLEERVEIANTIETDPHEAIVYISIHFNASFNKKAKGFEVWYLPQDYRRNLINTEKISEEEKEIIPILNTMLEEEYTIESITLAEEISKGLKDEIGKITEDRGLKEESWFVVRNARMPSVLLELGFISNKDEAVQLQKESYLKNLAKGVYNGICSFISQFENTKGFTE